MNWRELPGSALPSNWQRAGWLLVFAFVVLALVVDKAASTVYAIFFLAGLWLLARGPCVRADNHDRWLLFAFAAYFIIGVACFFLGEQTRLGEKILGRDIRFLGAIPVFFVIAALRIPVPTLTSAFGIGGVVTGVVAVVQVWSGIEDGRAGGETISIVFGHLSAALAVVNLAFALHRRKPGRWIALSGFAGAVVAVMLSGTRGAVLTLLLAGLCLVAYHCGANLRQWLKAGVLVAALVLVALVTPLTEMVSERFADGLRQVRQHQASEALLEQYPPPDIYPSCVDSPQLLKWMIDSSALRVIGRADVKVVQDGTFASAGEIACAGSAIVTVHAMERVKIVLPERNVAPAAEPAPVIVRGAGLLRFAVAGQPPRRFDSDMPRLLQADGIDATQARQIIELREGASIAFTLVATNPGEYRFPDASGPVVSRLHMWRAAVAGFLQEPALGIGTGAYPLLLEKRAAEGISPWDIVSYDHAHNEILNVAAERGLVGLLVLLAIYLVPLLLFGARRDAAGIVGMALVAAFALSGLTETIFNHSLAITYYCVLVLLLACAPDEKQGRENSSYI